MNKEVNEKKKKYAIVITFLVLMICITGGTYAYFALTASNNSVTGSVGGASLNLTVTKVYPTSEHNSKNMIPQLESTLDEAISLEHKCVDGNGNVICQVYSATVTNVGSTTSVLNGMISFEGLERISGLYDKGWNLLVSWGELVNDYGLDIAGESYKGITLASIIKNNNNLLNNVNKIIIDEGVVSIGYNQFDDLYNVEEIVVPNNVFFEHYYALMSTGVKTIYYSGNDPDGLATGWGSEANVVSNKNIMSSMPNLKWMRINDSNTLGTYSSSIASTEKALFEEERSFGANTSNTYYFVFWIDETGEVQTDSGTFRANIEFDSSTGGLTSTVRPSNPLLSDYIISLYNDGSSTTNATVGDGPQTVSLNSNQKLMKVNQGDTYGEEYRYYGASPNNYVDFNGELWRIISVSKVFSSESDTTGETRVRIIKDTPIGNYLWDDLSEDANGNLSNNWADATLMCQLNTIYYNDTVPACTGKSLTSLNTSLNTEARNLIDNALWYLGGGDTSDLYADDYYTMERGTAVADSSYPYRWTGKLGLMYPSDCAYAADLSLCTKTGFNYMDWDSFEPDPNCTGTNWLFNRNYQWLMSPNSGNPTRALHVHEEGYIGDDYRVDDGLGVRPLAILKSDVTKLEGEGTSGNPYRLGLGT